MANVKLKNTNKEYWEDRQLALFNDGEKDALYLAKDLQKNYQAAIREIEKEINAFYGKFASENKISLSEAKKLLSTSELKSFNAQLQEYMDYANKNNFSKSYLTELNYLKYKAKISRLEELKVNIKFQIAKLSKKNYDKIKTEMLKEYDYSYLNNIFNFEKSAGISISFAKPANNVVNKYLSQTINLSNYAIGENQIWENKIPKLMNILEVKIPQGIMLGQNPTKVAKIASDTLNTDYNATVRLVRTEYNYIFNEATNDSYKACNIAQYQILATLDERTCKDCGPLDLTIVNLDEREVGLNCPPFHPNCRCTTIPYFEKDEFDIPTQRIAKDKNGQPYMVPADLTFNEWKAGLTEHEGGLLYWKSK